MSATRLLGALDDPNKVLTPVSGVGKTPEMGLKPAMHTALQESVALQQACAAKGLSNLDHLVDLALAFAAQLPSYVLGKVSIDEAAAINFYTMESPFYSAMNGVLRAEDRSEVKPYLPYIRLLHSALAKMPHVKATVYRGVKADLHKAYDDGQRVVWWSLSSCTKEMKTLENPMFLGNEGARTMFAITATFVDIQQFSAIKAESEMLLACGAQLKVTSHLDVGNGLYMIQLEETAIPTVLGQLMKILGVVPTPTPTPPAPVPVPPPVPTPTPPTPPVPPPIPPPIPGTFPAWMCTLPASISDDVKAIFVREQIDEPTLLILTEKDLQELGIPFGPRKLLMAEIEARNKKPQKPTTYPFKNVIGISLGAEKCGECTRGPSKHGTPYQNTYLCLEYSGSAKWLCHSHLTTEKATSLPAWTFDPAVVDSGAVVLKEITSQIVPLVQKGLRHVLYRVKGAEDEDVLRDLEVLGTSSSVVSLLLFDITDRERCQVTDLHLSKIRGMLQMQSLSLSFCGRITDEGLNALKGMTQMQSLNLLYCRGVTDAGLTALKGMTQMKSLNLSKCWRITDLTALQGMVQMRSLNLYSCTGITDAGLTALQGMVQLQSLNLCDCGHVTDAGLTVLKEMSQMLLLDLTYCSRITDQGLIALKGMVQMQLLSLWHCNLVTDAGLNALKGMIQMQALSLSEVRITDAGLTALKGMLQIRWLDLSGCELITDAGVVALKGMVQMEKLNLSRCELITDVGLAALKGMTQMQSLDLSGCSFVTATALKGMVQMQSLRLYSCPLMTDVALTALYDMTALSTLAIWQCPLITPAGVTALRAKLGATIEAPEWDLPF